MSIENFTPRTGRTIKEDGTIVNMADLLLDTLNTNGIIQVERVGDGINLEKTALGQFGGVYVADTNEHVPSSDFVFIAIQVLTDSVLTLVGDIEGITGVAIDKGSIVYGRYTSLTLASGSVIAYQGA